jgi:hypothetical protein
VSVAERAPVAVGEKTTAALQLDPAKRLAPQVELEIKKSPALAPDIAMLIGMFDELSFVTVTCCEFPEAPMGTFDQVRVEGETLTPETETQPVWSSAHPARIRLTRNAFARTALGLVGVGEISLRAQARGKRFTDNEEGSVESLLDIPGVHPAGATGRKLPASCI